MKRNNYGFSFLVVIAAMVIVSILVVTGLTLANANYFMKFSEEKSNDTKYSAEAAVNEIKAGLENDSAIIISECYNSIITASAKIPSSNINDELKYLIIKDFNMRFNGDNEVYSAENGMWKNVIDSTTGKLYNAHIESYLVHTEGVEITNYPTFIPDYTKYTFRFQNLSLKYTDPNGVYSGTITTDIVFRAPDAFFLEKVNTNIEHAYEEYSLVGDNGLNIEVCDVSGNVYAGDNGINVCYDSSSFIEGDYSVIINNDITTRGSIKVNKQGTLKTKGGKIFAGGIETVNEGALGLPHTDYTALDIDGEINLNGDTLLNVPYANAKMKGTYYGFNNEKNSESSAFIINASNIDADLTGLTTLFLGGTSYLNIPTEEGANEILTGESLTGKFSQNMYLVPSCCIKLNDGGVIKNATNPIKFGDIDKLVVDLSQNKKYGGIDLTRFADMDSAKPYYTVVTSYQEGMSIDNNRVYIYLKFKNTEKAAEYASSFNSLKNGYIDNRATGFKYGQIVIGNGCTLSTAGNAILRDQHGNITFREYTPQSAFETVSAFQMSTRFASFATECSNLGSENVTDLNDNLYEYLINESEVSNTTCDVIDTNVTCTDVSYYNDSIVSTYSGDTFTALIGDGDVYVTDDYSGIIITNGNIYFDTPRTAKLEGLFIAKEEIYVKGGVISNITSNLEYPAQYILEFFDNKNAIRRYFNHLDLYEDEESDGAKVIYGDYFNFERWNTR